MHSGADRNRPPDGLTRRQFGLAAISIATGAALGVPLVGCVPKPTIADARFTLIGLWDAVVPGIHNGVVQDRLPDGSPAPGAAQAGVQQWMEHLSGRLPPPLDYVTDGFLRAWAADLDLWADVFHLPIGDGPAFGELPLGPTFAERGRQYKVMLMTGLFDGVLELKYVAAVALAKAAFYGDFWAEVSGGERVGSSYIGFRGPVGTEPLRDFTYGRDFGMPDARLVTTTNGLRNAP